jgi:putative transposase
MPRHARAILPDVAVHIIQRGNNRSACFHRDADYLVYLDHLRELSRRHACDVHAYCLMTNHVHLLVTPRAESACALLMKNLGQRYVQYVNRSRERTGTLWEGRFRSCIAQSDRYVLACYRYIELNPVRAGMVSDPAHYPWSSYRANALGQANPILSPHPLYVALAAAETPRRETYRALFRGALDEAPLADLRMALNQDQPVGNSRFYAEIEAITGQRRELRKRGRPRKRNQHEPGVDTAQQVLPL